MPQIFRIGPYIVYFWSNESVPLEPVHVHVALKKPSENATKIWITMAGKCLLCNNSSAIPSGDLKNIMRIIESRAGDVIGEWKDFFGEIRFYC